MAHSEEICPDCGGNHGPLKEVLEKLFSRPGPAREAAAPAGKAPSEMIDRARLVRHMRDVAGRLLEPNPLTVLFDALTNPSDEDRAKTKSELETIARTLRRMATDLERGVPF